VETCRKLSGVRQWRAILRFLLPGSFPATEFDIRHGGRLGALAEADQHAFS
jgi:hypothetical protein